MASIRGIFAFVLLLVSCSKSASSDSIKCGEGTELKGGKCVVAAPPSQISDAQTLPDPAPEVPTPQEEAWTYKTTTDKMRGTSMEWAGNVSTKPVYLPSPYGGGTLLKIMLRKGATNGNEAMIFADRGAGACAIECAIAVKFDDGPVKNYRAHVGNGAELGQVLLFIDDALGFTNKVKAAKRALIEVSFLVGGARQFEFDLAGLKWEPLTKK